MEGFKQSFMKENNTTINLSISNKSDNTQVNLITEDIQDNRFVTTITTYKRSKLQGQLKQELFDTMDNRVHKINQSGFCTNRPLEWLLAIEKYGVNCHYVRTRWFYKVDDMKKYCECDILIYASYKINIQVSLTTGILLVKGQSFRKFIDKEFVKIGVNIGNYKNTNMIINPNHGKCKDENDINNLTKEVDALWEDVRC